MKVRPATAEDAATTAEIFVAAAREAWGAGGEAALEAITPPALGGGELVAEDRGGVVGFAVVEGCELDLLYTCPQAWGPGAGRALLVAAEADAARRRLRRGDPVDGGAQRAARRLYQVSGWRPD